MFDKKFITSVLPDAQILCDFFPSDFVFSIDTRTLKVGDIFIAFQGQSTDGHNYIVEALDKGAAGLIINNSRQDLLNKIDKDLLKEKFILLVHDTYQALYKLAKAWRTKFDYPVVGITGSVGKTSTREMVTNVLSLQKKSFVATSGNYCSLIGLALSILRMRDHHEVGVFEIGISKRGEMGQAVDILRPTIAAITSVGHSHMEGLGSLQDIANEKRLIFKYFKADSVGIVNGDQSYLSDIGYMHPVIKFGAKSTNQVQARKIRINSDQITFLLKLYRNKYAVRLQSSHEGRVVNALAAASICYLLHVDEQVIVDGVQLPITIGSRFEFLPLKGGNGFVINDCYNASPESVKAALLAIDHIKTKAYKVAVLGDMLELGVDSSFWHRQIGRFLRKTPSIQEVFLVGKWIRAAQILIPAGIKVTLVENLKEISDFVHTLAQRELLILIKASHGMNLDVVVDEIAQRPISFAGAKKVSEDLLVQHDMQIVNNEQKLS